MNVLLADDNPKVKLSAKLIMDSWKYHLDFASNGKEAYEKLKSKRYDICLLDINMPVMNGFEAAKLIRTILPFLPIIAVTGESGADVEQKCLEYGINDYVQKPWDINKLHEKIIAFTRRLATMISTGTPIIIK